MLLWASIGLTYTVDFFSPRNLVKTEPWAAPLKFPMPCRHIRSLCMLSSCLFGQRSLSTLVRCWIKQSCFEKGVPEGKLECEGNQTEEITPSWSPLAGSTSGPRKKKPPKKHAQASSQAHLLLCAFCGQEQTGTENIWPITVIGGHVMCLSAGILAMLPKNTCCLESHCDLTFLLTNIRFSIEYRRYLCSIHLMASCLVYKGHILLS